MWSRSTEVTIAASASIEVHRVEPTPEPDLQHRRIETHAREKAQDGERRELEIRQRHVAARRLDGFELFDQRRVGGTLAVDAGTFVEVEQVRRGVKRGAKAACAQDAVQHRAGRPLAIGAADDDGRNVESQRQPVRNDTHPIQPQVNALRMQALEARQPVGQRR